MSFQCGDDPGDRFDSRARSAPNAQPFGLTDSRSGIRDSNNDGNGANQFEHLESRIGDSDTAIERSTRQPVRAGTQLRSPPGLPVEMTEHSRSRPSVSKRNARGWRELTRLAQVTSPSRARTDAPIEKRDSGRKDLPMCFEYPTNSFRGSLGWAARAARSPGARSFRARREPRLLRDFLEEGELFQ